jgi:hypothetical protein
MKQEKQKHDMCKTKIQQDFIAKNKQNKNMTRKCTQD